MAPFLKNCLEIWLELSPWLLVGLAAAGALHVLAPAEWIKNHLGGRGVSSVWKAVLIGTPMPLCSCGVIPAALGLRRDGASKGASLAFLISTPQTGVDSISVSAAFLGWPFALYKVFAAVVTGLAGGWLAEKVEPESPAAESAAAAACSNAPAVRTWRHGLEQADDLLRMIGFWLVIGVIVSALISTLFGDAGLARLPWTQGLPGMFLMLVISLPLYVCATASVPIAAALVHAGLPGGAALVFLMAGPASNLATIGAVHRAFGTRLTGLYLAVLAIGSIGLGLVFDHFWGVTVSHQAGHVHDHCTSWWAWAAGIIVALALCRHGWLGVLSLLPGKGSKRTLLVTGMRCGGCAATLERHLRQVPGVTAAHADAATGKVTVSGKVDDDALAAAIRAAGFELPESGT